MDDNEPGGVQHNEPEQGVAGAAITLPTAAGEAGAETPPVVIGDGGAAQFVGGLPEVTATSVAGIEGETAGEAGGVDTAAALLAAGRTLFARHGYAGASVRAITAEAGANLGAITYHFGSKKTLYNRVVEECVFPLGTRVEAALARPVPVLDRIEGVIRAYFDHFADNPDLPQLMLQEVVLGGGPPEAAGPTMRRIYALLLDAVREGQAAGEIRDGDPVLLVMSVITQPIFPMLLRRPIQAISGLDLEDGRTRERVIAHVVGFARRALSVTGEEEP